MAIQHAKSGQPVNVRASSFTDSEQRQTVALFKTADLEVMRLVLQRGKSMPMHKVQGDITVHCLEGMLLFQTQGSEKKIQAGELLYLDGGVPHAIVALEDACALVHIVLRPSAAITAST